LAEYLSALETDVDDCVTICWTSGTEAEPKAVPRCHGDWLATAGGCVQAAGMTRDDVLLSPFPMTNMAGIGGMFLPWLLTGACSSRTTRSTCRCSWGSSRPSG